MNIRDNTLSERERLFIAATRVHTACKYKPWYITSSPNGEKHSIEVVTATAIDDVEASTIRNVAQGITVEFVVNPTAIPWGDEDGQQRDRRRRGRR